jgi:hypothetical protein
MDTQDPIVSWGTRQRKLATGSSSRTFDRRVRDPGTAPAPVDMIKVESKHRLVAAAETGLA